MTTTAQPPTTTDQRLRLPALVEYRAAAAKRRAEAFCDAPEYVLGIEVLPLTPATYSMLFAMDSRFIAGGTPTEGDVRNYLWFHSPLYAHCGVKDWPARKRTALRDFTRQIDQPWRRRLRMPFDAERYFAVLALAITDIRRLVAESFSDCPVPSGRPGAPLATLEAHLIHQFAAAYDWVPERTRRTPLRRLFQLVRCIRAAHGEDVQDHGEQEILADHMRLRMAEIVEARRARAEVTP